MARFITLFRFFLVKQFENGSSAYSFQFSFINLMWGENVLISLEDLKLVFFYDNKSIIYISEPNSWSNVIGENMWFYVCHKQVGYNRGHMGSHCYCVNLFVWCPFKNKTTEFKQNFIGFTIRLMIKGYLSNRILSFSSVSRNVLFKWNGLKLFHEMNYFV